MRAAAKEDAAGSGDTQEAPCREVHIRLAEGTARQEADLSPLRDRLAEYPGSALVFIHLPFPGGEAVIRAASRIAAESAQCAALAACAGVADVRRA
jgi:hypothetical protein